MDASVNEYMGEMDPGVSQIGKVPEITADREVETMSTKGESTPWELGHHRWYAASIQNDGSTNANQEEARPRSRSKSSVDKLSDTQADISVMCQ